MGSVSNLSSVLEEFCLLNPDDKYCESFRYETTITIDDVNYIYLNNSENTEMKQIYGKATYQHTSVSCMHRV